MNWRKPEDITIEEVIKSRIKVPRKISKDEYFCIFCGESAYWDTDYGQQLFDYCPWCGVKMRDDSEKKY